MLKMKTSNPKKLSRRDAYLAVCMLHAGEAPADCDLDGLLLYFAPAAPKTAKTPEAWAVKAVDPAAEVNKNYKMYGYSSDGRMWVTDGSRVHCAPTAYPPGFYEPTTLNAVDVKATWPVSVAESLLSHSAADPFDVDDLKPVTRPRSTKPFDWAYETPNGEQFCKKYVDEALNGHTDVDLWHSDDRLWGTHASGQFVIAALRK